jgi:hypothetical protein
VGPVVDVVTCLDRDLSDQGCEPDVFAIPGELKAGVQRLQSKTPKLPTVQFAIRGF